MKKKKKINILKYLFFIFYIFQICSFIYAIVIIVNLFVRGLFNYMSITLVSRLIFMLMSVSTKSSMVTGVML